MAQVTLGFVTSHGPILGPTDAWLRLVETDKRDIRLNYEELLRSAPPNLEAEIAPEKLQERYESVQAAIGALREVIVDSKPDAVVMLSNPHGSVPYGRMQPVFGIVLTAEPEGPDALRRPRFEAPGTDAEASQRTDEGSEYPTDSALADHIMESLVDEGFDIACAFETRAGIARDHAFTVLNAAYLPDDSTIPMVPFVISRYAPNLATPARCYALGQAIRRAIGSWRQDKTVAIMASGGLSHQILDEELDRTVVDALLAKDTNALCSLPRDRLNRGGGTPEILNWVALAGAMETTPMTLIDYVPCYRSVAGTGQGMTFAYWK